jgi:hypothetical protein
MDHMGQRHPTVHTSHFTFSTDKEYFLVSFKDLTLVA